MAQPVRRSPRGALIPKSRPDVEARQQEKTVNPNGELYGRALKNKNRRNKKKQNRDKALREFAVDGLPIGRMAQPVRRSPRAALIPKSRPDVEARQQEKTANPNGDAPQNYADVDGLPIGRMAQPVRRSPRGALIPKSRPDIEARQQEKTVNPNGELYGRALKNRRNKTKQKRDKALREFADRSYARNGN